MARYNCIPPVTGTIDDFCIYQMRGRYYLRSRSSLTRERVKQDPAFAQTRHFAGLMARASKIGSAVYASLPADCKKHPLYLKLTGEAMTWLKYGWKEEAVLDWLKQRYTREVVIELCRQIEAPLPAEEEATRHIARINRRLLRALRASDDDSILEDLPPDWQQRILFLYSG